MKVVSKIVYFCVVFFIGAALIAEKIPLEAPWSFIINNWITAHIFSPLLRKLLELPVLPQQVVLFLASFVLHWVSSVIEFDKTQSVLHKALSQSIETWGVVGVSLVLFRFFGIGVSAIWLVIFIALYLIGSVTSLLIRLAQT